MLKKPLTLNQTWVICLRMWRWIAKNWKPGNSVRYLKRKWLYNNGFKNKKYRPAKNCFFCDYNKRRSDGTCENCPAVLVDSKFHCSNIDYSYDNRPKEFYQKLLELNRIRKQRIKKQKKIIGRG